MLWLLLFSNTPPNACSRKTPTLVSLKEHEHCIPLYFVTDHSLDNISTYCLVLNWNQSALIVEGVSWLYVLIL